MKHITLTLVTTAFIFIYILGCTTYMKAQKQLPNVGLTLSQGITASRHQSNFSPGIQIKYKEHIVNLAAAMNFNNVSFKGMNICYKYILNESNRENIRVYANIQAIYRKGANLNTRLNRLVYQAEYLGEGNTFTTLETYAGFGLQIPVLAGFSLDASLGAGTYRRTIEQAEDHRIANFTRFSMDQAAGLSMSVGICYCFK